PKDTSGQRQQGSGKKKRAPPHISGGSRSPRATSPTALRPQVRCERCCGCSTRRQQPGGERGTDPSPKATTRSETTQRSTAPPDSEASPGSDATQRRAAPDDPPARDEEQRTLARDLCGAERHGNLGELTAIIEA